MLVLLSPAKKQDFSKVNAPIETSLPFNITKTAELVKLLKSYSKDGLAQLMSLSDSLAELNHQRFQVFSTKKFNTTHAKPAIYAFQGDAYQSLHVTDFSESELVFLNQHLLILSGLYGYLRPMDLIQPYRLEMKIPLSISGANNLYEFWRELITAHINQIINKHTNKIIVNLGSNEYFKAIFPKKLIGDLVTIHFKEKQQDGAYKSIGIHAKRARGLMVRYIAKHRIDGIEGMKNFNESGYQLSKQLSSNQALVFIR